MYRRCVNPVVCVHITEQEEGPQKEGQYQILVHILLCAAHHVQPLNGTQVTMTIVGFCSKGPAKQHSGTFV